MFFSSSVLLRMTQEKRAEVTAVRTEGSQGHPPCPYYVKTEVHWPEMAFLDKRVCACRSRDGQGDPRRPWVRFKGKESTIRGPAYRGHHGTIAPRVHLFLPFVRASYSKDAFGVWFLFSFCSPLPSPFPIPGFCFLNRVQKMCTTDGEIL